MLDFTAEIGEAAFGPFVSVSLPGQEKPWEFTVTDRQVRTPMRRRYTCARAIEYVAGKVAGSAAL
jgi:hypothetical protein